MNPWQLIFLQSKANTGGYDGDRLPTHYWSWPQGTWFQKRLLYIRMKQQGWDIHRWQENNDGPKANPNVAGLTATVTTPFDLSNILCFRNSAPGHSLAA
jgi:hypothetical protein